MKKQGMVRAVVVVLASLFLGFAGEVQAQKFKRMLHRIDSVLSVRYHRSKIDTMYITRPETKWTLKGIISLSGAAVEVEGKEFGRSFTSKMDADYKSTLSVSANYLGVSLSLSLNPAKLLGKYNDFELNINSYNNRWGFDFIYQDASNFTGWHEEEGQQRIELPPEVLTMKTLNVNAYYAFNHRRFSYPAAFTQSYIQRRSAGSFLLGISGQGQKAETNATQQSVLKVTNIGLGAGYGYNWVPGRNWLLHLSVLPTLIVYSHTSLTVNDNRIPLDYHFPEVIITGRGAIVRQFGRFFVAATMVYNYSNIGDRDQLAVYNAKWRARLSVGYRF